VGIARAGAFMHFRHWGVLPLSFLPLFSPLLCTGLAGFCQKVEKTVFSMVKTGLAKILFVGKNRLCQNCHQSKLEP